MELRRPVRCGISPVSLQSAGSLSLGSAPASCEGDQGSAEIGVRSRFLIETSPRAGFEPKKNLPRCHAGVGVRVRVRVDGMSRVDSDNHGIFSPGRLNK